MTVAALKRTLVPGTRVHVTNHYIPTDSREAEVVHASTAGFTLTHARAQAQGYPGSYSEWPKRAELRANEDGSITFLGQTKAPPPTGEPWLTLRVLP